MKKIIDLDFIMEITDAISVSTLIKKIKPNEIYNLADNLTYRYLLKFQNICKCRCHWCFRILEAIKFHGFEKKTKFYQAGTSEMFGNVKRNTSK